MPASKRHMQQLPLCRYSTKSDSSRNVCPGWWRGMSEPTVSSARTISQPVPDHPRVRLNQYQGMGPAIIIDRSSHHSRANVSAPRPKPPRLQLPSPPPPSNPPLPTHGYTPPHPTTPPTHT